MTKFEINKDVFEKCTKFAADSVGTSIDKYAQRKQYNSSKIQKDIRVGKIGEVAVYNFLSEKYPDITYPDFNIYDKKDKSWDADLKIPNTNISVAVKSQDAESSIAYGDSWVFQFNMGKSYDCDSAIFKEEDDDHYVSFVSLNTPKKTGEIRAIVKVSWLHKKNMFKPMKLKHLQGNKVAVYLEDLQKHEDIWQLC